MKGHAAILGWAGSTTRQLRTVAAWYEARGLTPIVVEPRVFRAMGLPWGWRREGDRLAARLIDRAGGPLVVHAFSNAGFWTYAAALRSLTRRRSAVLDRIAALVLDSAPGFPAKLEARFTSHYSAMAMMPILLQALGRPPALSHPVLDAPMRAFMRLWYHVSPLQIREAERSLDVVRDTGRWPILAMYSSADTLVSAQHVEAFLASMRDPIGPRGSLRSVDLPNALRANGALRTSGRSPSPARADRDVRAIRWEDSEHVRHMIVHRREYLDAVGALLERAAVAQPSR